MSTTTLPAWYPAGVNHVIDLEGDPAPYGEPEPRVLDALTRRLPGPGRILDVAGGYGRYAVPLARAGHDVVVVDVDPPHLAALRRYAAVLPAGSGQVRGWLVDVTVPGDMTTLRYAGCFDGSLCAAFLYLPPPPAVAAGIFAAYAPLHRPGGVAVVQFSTEIDRRGPDGEQIVGESEYRYTREEGLLTLEVMFAAAGFADVQIEGYEIAEDDAHGFTFHARALIASGVYRGAA